jgi:hypothetical protein
MRQPCQPEQRFLVERIQAQHLGEMAASCGPISSFCGGSALVEEAFDLRAVHLLSVPILDTVQFDTHYTTNTALWIAWSSVLRGGAVGWSCGIVVV